MTLPGFESYTIHPHIGGFGWWVCRGEYKKGGGSVIATCRSITEATLIRDSLNLPA
jgi:hypothetical protein